MKTEELSALGLSEEQVTQVLAMNGRDIEKHKTLVTNLTAERDDLKQRLTTAETTLNGFGGKNPEQIQEELNGYKQQAEEAEKQFNAQLMKRDQKDWLGAKFDEYGVISPYVRAQLMSECMAEGSGLAWRDDSFFGFDDFMKAAKAKDGTIYQTAEEKQAAEAAQKAAEKAPRFTAPAGATEPGKKTFSPPKLF